MDDVLLSEGAARDYAESLRWYAERGRHIAVGFESAVILALNAIRENPEGYPFCDDRHRFCLLKRYPHHIVYRQLEDARVFVAAIAHGSRQPGFWKERLPRGPEAAG